MQDPTSSLNMALLSIILTVANIEIYVYSCPTSKLTWSSPWTPPDVRCQSARPCLCSARKVAALVSTYVHVCICMCSYIYVYMHICIHIYIYIDRCTYVRTYVRR